MLPYKAQQLLIAFTWLVGQSVHAQSFEVMVGHERVFVDVQFLEPLSKSKKLTLFSRSRAAVDYNDKSDLFTGAYLNYTSRTGFGPSVVGSISATGGAADTGIHFFKSNAAVTLFALISYGMDNEERLSWFSILRYRKPINARTSIFASLELFSTTSGLQHAASVERVRVGLAKGTYQFGPGINLGQFGKDLSTTMENVGVFVRREF